MRKWKAIIILSFAFFSVSCSAQKILQFNKPDTNYIYYYKQYDKSVRDFKVQTLMLGNPDNDGFSKVSGSTLAKSLFRREKIKILDSSIEYKMTDSEKVFVFLDCQALNKKMKYKNKIFRSYNERLHWKTDSFEASVQSVEYDNSKNADFNFCGKPITIYEFKLYDASGELPYILGFSPGKGIVYFGYTIAFMKPDQLWYLRCVED